MLLQCNQSGSGTLSPARVSQAFSSLNAKNVLLMNSWAALPKAQTCGRKGDKRILGENFKHSRGNCPHQEGWQTSEKWDIPADCRLSTTSNLFTAAPRIRPQESTCVSVSPHSTSSGTIPRIVARSGRSLLYDETDTYVLLEPGEEEVFVNEDELRGRLKSWLVNWPGNELPEDLARYGSLDEVVSYLVDSACELDLGGGLGSVQWYEIRLE